ncbi:arsenate reductase (glutaredoxin) [Maribrevibacterium harenarium]|uniref:Arsenate reductase n=1 Tax=Maribrevibacterium harenarium TaxID=2589817 RepID=A0A501WQD5_9GAMM|nr:arsenate reductase (glutaredoxin) [Maribrevibacterium harenarium]TPE51993.1 arsenate reductase (glutaredoxin) [Maribrevibacterium harenarium]
MTTIYHNPRCSKSRETLALLTDRNTDLEVIKYLEDPLSKDTLRSLLEELGFASARDLMRTKEDIYKELGLAEVTDEDQLLEAMSQHPKLIERPIVSHQGKAKIGRPPESVLALFE